MSMYLIYRQRIYLFIHSRSLAIGLKNFVDVAKRASKFSQDWKCWCNASDNGRCRAWSKYCRSWCTIRRQLAACVRSLEFLRFESHPTRLSHVWSRGWRTWSSRSCTNSYVETVCVCRETQKLLILVGEATKNNEFSSTNLLFQILLLFFSDWMHIEFPLTRLSPWSSGIFGPLPFPCSLCMLYVFF